MPKPPDPRKRPVADGPEYPTTGGCQDCPMQERCRARVRRNIWVMCETPDTWDLIRAEEVGFPYVEILGERA